MSVLLIITERFNHFIVLITIKHFNLVSSNNPHISNYKESSFFVNKFRF